MAKVNNKTDQLKYYKLLEKIRVNMYNNNIYVKVLD